MVHVNPVDCLMKASFLHGQTHGKFASPFAQRAAEVSHDSLLPVAR